MILMGPEGHLGLRIGKITVYGHEAMKSQLRNIHFKDGGGGVYRLDLVV